MIQIKQDTALYSFLNKLSIAVSNRIGHRHKLPFGCSWMNDVLLTHGSGPYVSFAIFFPKNKRLQFALGGYGFQVGPGGCFNLMPKLAKEYGYIYSFRWLIGSLCFFTK